MVTLFKAKEGPGHVCMFGSYESTFYRWTAAFYGPKISRCVKKFLSIEDGLLDNFSTEIHWKFGIFGPYFSGFWPEILKNLSEWWRLMSFNDRWFPSTFFYLSANNHNYATRHSAVVSENIATPSYGLLKSQCKLDLRSNFFSQRVVSPWKDLPASVKNSVSIDNFKLNYDKAMS